MKFYSSILVEKVRKARIEGLSLRQLERKFKIPNNTISKWVRDIESSQKIFQNARLREKKWKADFSQLAHSIKINKSNAKIFVALLYWCEGSKYPASNALTFSNSDHSLVKIYIELLRKAFPVKESKFRVHLQIHTIHDREKLLDFWGKLLKIPKNQFYKPTVTKSTKNMKRRNYIGTCTIKYYDVKLLLNTIGIYENFAKIVARRGARVV